MSNGKLIRAKKGKIQQLDTMIKTSSGKETCDDQHRQFWSVHNDYFKRQFTSITTYFCRVNKFVMSELD